MAIEIINQQPVTLQASAAQTGNNTSSQGTPQALLEGVSPMRGVVAYVIVTAVSGTTPSMTVTLQDSPDGTNFASTGAATAAITGIGVYRIAAQNLGAFIQASSAITGTTPSFTYSIVVVGTQ